MLPEAAVVVAGLPNEEEVLEVQGIKRNQNEKLFWTFQNMLEQKSE